MSRKSRIIVYTLCGLTILTYFLYLCYLLYSIINDEPTLKVKQIFLNEIDVPDIEICGTSPDLKILRCDFIMTNNNENKQIDGCNNYILPNTINYGIYGENCLTFKANKTMKFIKPDDPMGGLRKIGFYFYENTTAAEVNTLEIASLTVQLTPPGFNPLINPNQAISQMDKATLSEFKLQLNFVAGMANYAAMVNFKTSTYRSILPSDSSAIFGFGPKYHMTPKIENFVNYFPFNNNPHNIPVGTTGYFSVAAGSFIQEQTTEQRSNTILGALAAAGGTFGIMAGTIMFIFGRANPLSFAYKFRKFIQKSGGYYKRTRFYPKLDFKFSKINNEDKQIIEIEFMKIRYAINHYLLQGNEQKSGKINNWLLSKIGKINYWLLDTRFTEEVFKVYQDERKNRNRVRNLKFSEINKDWRLIEDEFNKIKHVIDIYLLNIPKDSEKFAEYKYKRELKFSDNMDEGDKNLLNDEFRKIRKLIDKHLLGTPNIEEIFDKYNSDYNRELIFSPKMDEEDGDLLNYEFNQIRHVIFNYLLDIPKDEKIFKSYNKNSNNNSDRIYLFTDNMKKEDKESIVYEFFKIRYVINSHLFNERKNQIIFKKYIEERELKFTNEMHEKDKKLISEEFDKIRYVIDNFLLIEQSQDLKFASINESDEKLLNDELRNIRHNYDDELRKIRQELKYIIDNHVLNIV